MKNNLFLFSLEGFARFLKLVIKAYSFGRFC
jgi:hypothetical protein